MSATGQVESSTIKAHASRRPVNRLTFMSSIERLFEIYFARFRRGLGGTPLELAWRRASNAVLGYLVLPAAAIVIAGVIVIYALTKSGNPADRNQIGQYAGIVVVPLLLLALRHRFKSFLLNPPLLRRLKRMPTGASCCCFAPSR
jgi:hypothetical protein